LICSLRSQINQSKNALKSNSNRIASCISQINKSTQMSAEQERFDKEVQAVKAWWATERFRSIRRPYTPEVVVSLRGTFKQSYASDALSKKLWTLLQKHHAAKTASHTFGALDPIQVAQMAKFIETVYVSGWQCSSTASSSNEPGPDLADYPVRVLFCQVFIKDGHGAEQGGTFVFGPANARSQAISGTYDGRQG
jgi:hypothetical protein